MRRSPLISHRSSSSGARDGATLCWERQAGEAADEKDEVVECEDNLDLCRGDLVYVVVLASLHTHEFQYGCLTRWAKQEVGGMQDLSRPIEQLLSGWRRDNPFNSVPGLLEGVEVNANHLTEEQHHVLKRLVNLAGSLHVILSHPGAGKSRLAACLVGQFVAGCRGEAWAEGTEPLVVMATARRCHRADLLRTTFNFVPEDACFIVESGKDHDLGPGDVQSFLNDRAQKKFVEVTAEVRKELSSLDSRIAEAKQKEEELILLTLHTERSFLHYTGLVWGHGDVFQDFAKTVKVVICTTEHLKKALQGKPWWARERRLHTLVLDEVEAHSSLDLFALCGHFSQVVCMGDADQRIPEYMVPAKHMPSSDIMCEEVERGNANIPGDPLRKLTSGALEWLWAHGQVHYLREVHRFGTAVAEFAQSLSSRFNELRVHPSAPQTTVQVIKFVGVCAGGYISHLSRLHSTIVPHTWAGSAAMLLRHCRPPLFLQANNPVRRGAPERTGGASAGDE